MHFLGSTPESQAFGAWRLSPNHLTSYSFNVAITFHRCLSTETLLLLNWISSYTTFAPDIAYPFLAEDDFSPSAPFFELCLSHRY